MKYLPFVEKKINERLSSGNDDAFYVLDVEDVRMKYRQWVEKIPQVHPFYAVKCNDDERVLKALVELGCGFDCASKKELDQMLSLGVHPEKMIYAHTVKQVSHLKFAARNNIKKVTFDSPAELMKIKIYHPEAEVVLRIRFDAENSLINLGLKFGCDPISEAPELIKLCNSLKMNLIGISFHVGSGNSDHTVYKRALRAVRELFDFAAIEGFNLHFVDIGGGFMGNDMSLLDGYAESINDGVQDFFDDPSIQVISEPGRYFVESAFKLAVEVILKRVSTDGHIHYYINEGIYMSFMMGYLYDEKLTFNVYRKSGLFHGESEKFSTVWGSSCNSKDKIIDKKMLPDLNIGDWLIFDNMGHYTTACATSFNGFKVGEIFVA
jgi:ornithine decarboxylase